MLKWPDVSREYGEEKGEEEIRRKKEEEYSRDIRGRRKRKMKEEEGSEG